MSASLITSTEVPNSIFNAEKIRVPDAAFQLTLAQRSAVSKTTRSNGGVRYDYLMFARGAHFSATAILSARNQHHWPVGDLLCPTSEAADPGRLSFGRRNVRYGHQTELPGKLCQ